MAVLPQWHPPSDDPGALPRRRSSQQPTSGDPRSLGLRTPRVRRTAPCPWCQNPLPPACCARCLNKACGATILSLKGEAFEVQQQSFNVSLAKLGTRVALRERRAMLKERVAELRSTAERRAASLRERRRRLERRKELHHQRRQNHERLASECAAARRRLEAGRARMSLNEFLRSPQVHGARLPAFHAFNELSSLGDALRAERRRRVNEVVEIFPLSLKFIGSGGAGGDSTVTLGQLQSFTVAGVLQDEVLKDLEVALSFLMPLVSVLATYLDVTLPFPCTVGQGHAKACSMADGAAASPRESGPGGGRRSSPGRLHTSWARPSVLHPFRELGLLAEPRGDGWYYFRVYDGVCTSEFATALALVDEDLRRLCICQGTEAPAELSTLQLLSHCLSAAHLGCFCPPSTHVVEDQASGAASMAETAEAGAHSATISAAEDGEWTVLDHG